MSDSESERKGSTRIKRFHGRANESYTHYRLRLTSSMRQKGLWTIFEGDALRDDHDAAMWSATDIIVQSLGDKPLSVVADLAGHPRQMLAALDARYRGSTTTDVIILLGEIHNKTYDDSIDASVFVDELGDMFSRLKAIKSPMTDLMQVGLLLAKIPQSSAMHAAAAALRSMDPDQLTWEIATNRLVAEYKTVEGKSKTKGRTRKKGKGSKKGTLSEDVDDDDIDVASLAQAVALAMKEEPRQKRHDNCTYCGKSGHTAEKCFQNPDNPSNKLPQKLRERLLVADSSKSTEKKSKSKKTSQEQTVEVLAMVKEEVCTTVIPPESNSSANDSRCVMDSGATVSLFHSASSFVPGTLVATSPRKIALADKRAMVADMQGDVVICFDRVRLTISNCLFAPDLGYNLVSVGRLADKGIRSTFDADGVKLSKVSGLHIGQGVRESDSGLYYLPSPLKHSSGILASVAIMEKGSQQPALHATTTQLWHRRLAHIGINDLIDVSKWTDGVPANLDKSDVPTCAPCRMGKAHALPFSGKFSRAARVGQVVHRDMAGPLPPSYEAAYRYLVTFTDDCARHTSVGFLKRKSQLRDAFEQFKLQLADLAQEQVTSIQELHTRDADDYSSILGDETGLRIVRLHSDNAKEYKALERTQDHLATYSPTYTPELNAIAERVNRTIFDTARTLLIDAGIPICFWPFAVSHVAYVRNRVKHTTVGDCPYTVVTGNRPNMKNVRVFGCRAFVLVQPTPSKLEPRAEAGVLLSCKDHGMYTVMLFDGGDDVPRLVTSRHVTFDEDKFPGLEALAETMDEIDASDTDFSTDKVASSESEDSDDDDNWYSDDRAAVSLPMHNDSATQGEVSSVEQDSADSGNSSEGGENSSDDEGHPRSGGTGCQADEDDSEDENTDGKYHRYPGLSRVRKQTSAFWGGAFAARELDITTSDTPTLRDVLTSTPTEQELWMQSIEDEYQSLEEKGTWTLVEDESTVPSALPTHCVFKVKRLPGGVFERCKTRVLAGGNYQVFGVDYFETHAPVVDFATVRFFLRLAVIFSWKRMQLDIKTAFLNGDLEEEIYVRSPRGVPNKPSHVYRLRKAIYGLKQAHLAWHSRVVTDLRAAGFTELPSCPCVFVKWIGKDVVFILIYVDDLLVLSSNQQYLEETRDLIASLYELRVLEEINYYLGVELTWTNTGDLEELVLSQPTYIESVLKRFGMENARPCPTPMVEGFFTGIEAEEDTTIVEQNLYQQCIGCLLHISLRTRPDIMTAVGILSRYAAHPTAFCHKGAKRVLRYLRGTTDFGLKYGHECDSPTLSVFVDSDYASDITTRRSTSGMVVLLGGGLVQWHSKKQKSCAISTCEAEYRAMVDASMDLLLYRRVLREIKMPQEDPIPMHSDNEAAIKWASGERTPYKRSKHIDVAVHFIRELVRDGKVTVPYIPTDANKSDGMTKPLNKILFGKMTSMFGMIRAGNNSEEEC